MYHQPGGMSEDGSTAQVDSASRGSRGEAGVVQSQSQPQRKRSSSVYSFSSRDLYKYKVAQREGKLRFPDLFMYHIQRSTADVQREARLLKKLSEKRTIDVNEDSEISFNSSMDCPTPCTLQTIAIDDSEEFVQMSAQRRVEKRNPVMGILLGSCAVGVVTILVFFLWMVFNRMN